MKPAKMSDKNYRKKNYIGLQETARINRKTLFPATWSLHLFLIQMKSLPKYAGIGISPCIYHYSISSLFYQRIEYTKQHPGHFKNSYCRGKIECSVTLYVTPSQAPAAAERKPSCTIAGNICVATKKQLLHQDLSSHQVKTLLLTLRWQLFWGVKGINKWIPAQRDRQNMKNPGQKRIQ